MTSGVASGKSLAMHSAWRGIQGMQAVGGGCTYFRTGHAMLAG